MSRPFTAGLARTRGAGLVGMGGVWILALGLACATPRPLAIEPIPSSADPGFRTLELGRDLAAARSRDIDLLSPYWFGRAEEAYEQALDRLSEGEPRERVLAAVAEGDAALDRSEQTAERARSALDRAFRAREEALLARAIDLGEGFHVLEEEFRQLAEEVSAAGDVSAELTDRQDALARRYATLARKALQQDMLGDTRELLDQAAREDAEDRLPQLFATAQRSLDEAQQAFREGAPSREELRDQAERAHEAAVRVRELNRTARALDDVEPSALALALEERLERLARALGLADRPDLPFAERWQALEAAAADQRQDRDLIAAQNQELRQELERARREIETLTGDGPRNGSSEFDALFGEIEEDFAPEEAEVDRREGVLVIRLRAIRFDVGETHIEPADHGVLAKVQRAIRRFGQPRVLVEGHTDATGSESLNQRISQRRADAVREHLLATGVLPPHRIVALGVGSRRPLASNETQAGRARNRRIEIVIDPRRILFVAWR